MDRIDYSVIIRTTGNANEKYQKLLKSIAQLDPQPLEVIVVLPEGNDLPAERLGWESFHFCKRGMVRQRMEGIGHCKTRYALICDDDISFSSDFVKKLHAPIKYGIGCFSAAPLYSFLPDEGMNTAVCILMASAVPTILHRNSRYISVLKSTGYSYNRHLDRTSHKYYETQSAAWTCFYADVKALRNLEFDKEASWLDAHGYSALDDQTMFYKAWLMGLKTIIVSDAKYEHLDAKTSTRNNKSSVLFSRGFNRLVFWHRFIYTQQKNIIEKGLAQAAFCYYLLWVQIQYFSSVLRHRMTFAEWSEWRNGFRAAKKYLESKEYLGLPLIVRG